MKFNKILVGLLSSLMIAGSTITVTAQSRKTTGKRTTTTRKTTPGATAEATPKAGPLTEEDVLNKKYYCFSNINKLVVVSTLTLTKPSIKWKIMGENLSGDYSVADNKLSLSAGKIEVNATSPDNGKTLQGKWLTNDGWVKFTAYQILNATEAITPEAFISAVNAGKYYFELGMSSRGEVMGIPGSQIVFNTANKTWKIKGTSEALGEFASPLKGSYTIKNNGIDMILTTNMGQAVLGLFKIDNNNTLHYEGKTRVNIKGGREVYLNFYFFKK